MSADGPPAAPAPADRCAADLGDAARPERGAGVVATLCLHRFERALGRAWGFGQMGFARGPLRRLGPSFFKLMGAGRGVGFDPRPDFRVWASLAVWPDLPTARAALAAPVMARFRARADESWTAFLAPISSRGRWAGVAPFGPAPERAPPAAGPVAVLTRAALAPLRARRFWSRVPAISEAIAEQDAALLKIGLGEAPWVNQVTFSIWPDEASLQAFAHAPSGRHRAAVEEAWREGWFREQLFARFELVASEGAWAGASALAAPLTAPAAPRPGA